MILKFGRAATILRHSKSLFCSLLLLLTAESGNSAHAEASICIAPFQVTAQSDRAQEPRMSQTTWAPSADSHFEFRINGKLRARVARGEMATISGLPLDRRTRVKVSLDGRPFESLSLSFRNEPGRRICLWLYPGYWRWIDNGWNTHRGCRCKSEK